MLKSCTLHRRHLTTDRRRIAPGQLHSNSKPLVPHSNMRNNSRRGLQSNKPGLPRNRGKQRTRRSSRLRGQLCSNNTRPGASESRGQSRATTAAGAGTSRAGGPAAPPSSGARRTTAAQAQQQAARAAQQRQQAQEQARAAQERARAARQQRQRQAQERARVEQQRRDAEQQRARAAAEQQRANERNQVLEKQRREREAVERRRAEEQRRAVEQGRVPERFGQRPQPGTRQPVVVRQEQLRQERGKLSGDQQHRLGQAFPVNRDRIARVQFARRIGTRIPRSVSLFVVPAAVLAIFPYYRDYRYVVEDDTICIVDPDTYEIVDVLDEEPYIPGFRPPVPELTLSDSEVAFVLSSIPPDFPQAQVRLRLALGVEIPPSVELYEFAPMVLDRIPKLAQFRFVVTEDQLVVVAPQDRSIARVLDLLILAQGGSTPCPRGSRHFANALGAVGLAYRCGPSNRGTSEHGAPDGACLHVPDPVLRPVEHRVRLDELVKINICG